jgi:hypothetical protein
MNKILRAYERNILFGILPNKIVFTVPIYWRNGDEYSITCTLLETQPTLLQYEALRLPNPVDMPRSLKCCDPVPPQSGELR